MGSQHDAQKNHMKDFEEEFDDQSEKHFRNMSTTVAVKFFNCAYLAAQWLRPCIVTCKFHLATPKYLVFLYQTENLIKSLFLYFFGVVYYYYLCNIATSTKHVASNGYILLL